MSLPSGLEKLLVAPVLRGVFRFGFVQEALLHVPQLFGQIHMVHVGVDHALEGGPQGLLFFHQVLLDIPDGGLFVNQLPVHEDGLQDFLDVKVGDEVNIERSAKVGAENGGHNLYGHIEGTAQVTQIERRGETLHIDLQVPAGNIKYFFLKGFIGLNGCSLTVNHVDRVKSEISIDLIPETLRLTTWKSVQVGDEVNYEIDQMTRTLVDTLENIHLAKG